MNTVEANSSSRLIAPTVRRRRTRSPGGYRRRRRTKRREPINIWRGFWKAAAFTVFVLLMADVLAVVLLTEGAMHPAKALRIIEGPSPVISLAMLREIPGSRDHLRMGRFYPYGSGDSAAQASITASDGTLLGGIWAVPRHGAKKAVIVCHGFGESSVNSGVYASLLLSDGFAVLTPDSRGHGASGGFNTFGIREAGDIVQWVRAVKSLHIAEVYGLGESLGGAILLQSLERGADFRAVVAESPFASFFEIADDQVSDYCGPVLGYLLVRQAFLYGRWIRHVDLNEAQPVRSVSHSRVPILLVHDGYDRIMPPEHSLEIAQANPAIHVWSVPMATHTRSFAAAPVEFRRRMLSWFDR